MKFRSLAIALLAASALGTVGCVETRGHKGSSGKAGGAPAAVSCTDHDGDGFGAGCNGGHDCNDTDPSIHEGCLHCAQPSVGCACDSGERPVSCFASPTTDPDGLVMCHEGTRYCRDGVWSGCESIFSYPKPALSSDPQGIVSADAGLERCNDCDVNCYVIRDNLDPVDGGLGTTNVEGAVLADGGGISLQFLIEDAGTPDADVYDPSLCVPGTAPDHDCDGIPDMYDPYPDTPPFATANPAIFLDIGPGQTGTGVVALEFFLNSADIYFLVDQSGSMDGERDQLKADLTSGTFITDPSYQCSDFDFDRMPNNELKAEGIIGAVRCFIRDANFGVGFFREIPFSSSYAPNDQIVFRNYSDITGDLTAVEAAVGRLTTVGNNDWPEADMLALNTLVTGNGMYFGTTKPGIPSRTGCPMGTWGYPCFRDGAIPIVILFTDAQFHNGPTSNNYAYNSSALGITKGTTQTLNQLASTNETWGSAADLGDVTSSYVTYVGDMTSMASDLGHSAFSCGSSTSTTAPDAMFKFTLSSAKTVTLTTEGSDFDTTLALFQGVPTSATSVATGLTTNDAVTTAYDYGSVTNLFVSATGDNSTLTSNYSANDLGCSATPSGKDAVFRFTLSQASRVALDSSGSAIGTSVSLFSATPPSLPTFTGVTDTNDTLATTYSAGAMLSQNKAFTGDTSAAGITANYTAAQLGSCAPADAAPDATYSFTLASPTTVRLSTEGTAFPTVLALVSNADAVLPTTAVTGNELASSATDIGTLDNRSLQYTGNSSAMANDYTAAVTGCSAAGRDAVYKFTLGSTRTVSIDTDGSAFDTTLSLFSSAGVTTGDTAVTYTANTNEIGTSAYNLGTIDSTKLIVSGASTGSMTANYTSTQIGCSGSSSARDAVYKFHVTTPTTVRIDTIGSSYDTLISLHNGVLPDQSTAAVTGNDTASSPYTVSGNIDNTYQQFTGSTSTFAADVPVDDGAGCAASSSAADAVFKFTVGSSASYELSTVGSSFDTILGLYPSTIYNPSASGPTSNGSSGELKTSANDVGTLDGRWVSYTGSTTSMADDNDYISCGANKDGKDVYYKLHLDAQKSVTIDTIGSSWDTVLILFDSSDVEQACDDNSGGTGGNKTSKITRTLNAGDYYVVVKPTTKTADGNYKITFRDNSVTTNLLQCDDDTGGGGTSKITRTLSAGTYYAIVKGKASGDKGNYKLNIAHTAWVNAANNLTCNDDIGGGNTKSQIDASLATGDYFIVVKGKASGDSGSYTLTVQDISHPPTNAYITCNDDHSSVNTSLISQSLSAGTYYVVVKGKSSGGGGAYTLNIKDTAAAATATTLACNYNGGAGGSSLLEQSLSAGTYKVIVKGKAASDKGAYKLWLRDLTNIPSNRLTCDHGSGSGGKSYLESTLAAGTYLAVLTGDSASASGAYSLSVRDATAIAVNDTPLYCDNDTGIGVSSKLSQSLAAGTYYVGIKGYDSADYGNYQLNIGAGSTSSGTYVPPTWSETLAALQSTKARVMTVLSCHDDPSHGDVQGDCVATRSQATALANATDALGASLQPLVFDINSDGSGLSATVVDGVAALAEYLEMNVQVRIVFEPDANPGFIVNVRAIDVAGDECDGLIGLEHQKCKPGAHPRFELDFRNPAGSPVPKNPNDLYGGYNFRAELIGNNQFIVDEVPIYIIPESLDPPLPPPMVVPMGSYWQDLPSPGCEGNKRPDWNDLSWSADVPDGTSVVFNICTVEDVADFATCQYTAVASVVGTASCTADTDCDAALGQLCSATGNCQRITSGTCTMDEECPSGARCIAQTCTFDGQPVYVGGVLGTGNYKAYLRMKIDMTGNVTTNTSPIVYDWALTYRCSNKL